MQQVVCKGCEQEYFSPEDFIFFGTNVKNITGLKVGGRVFFLCEQFSVLQSLDILEIVYGAHRRWHCLLNVCNQKPF